MMKTILFSMFVTFTACGGSSKPKPAEPKEVMPKEPVKEEAKQEEPVEPAAPDPKQVAMEAETAAFETAKPVFDASCKSCHEKGQKNASAKKLASFEITAYPFTGKHANTKDIRKVLGIGGGKATMPKVKPGSVQGDDLAAIAAWADAFDAAEAAGAHAAE